MKNLQAQKLQNELNQQDVAKQGASESYKTAIDTLDRLEKHPGLSESVGMKPIYRGDIMIGKPLPGTDAAGFNAELEAFKSQTFLPMVQSLKGMGALSDAEGKKLTAAVGALDTSMSEKEFKDSIKRIRKDLNNARMRAGSSKANGSPNVIDFNDL